MVGPFSLERIQGTVLSASEKLQCIGRTVGCTNSYVRRRSYFNNNPYCPRCYHQRRREARVRIKASRK